MPYLFRTWSDQSHGVNSLTTFAPAAALAGRSVNAYSAPTFSADLKQDFKAAVANSKKCGPNHNPVSACKTTHAITAIANS